MTENAAEEDGWLKRLIDLNLFRGTKFAAVGLASFLFLEAVLSVFVLEKVVLLVATPVSYEVSIVFCFLLNDNLTVRDKGSYRWPIRALRFNLAYLLGIVIVTASVYLLAQRGVDPLVGTIVGVLLAFPVNYAVSMNVVWGQRLR